MRRYLAMVVFSAVCLGGIALASPNQAVVAARTCVSVATATGWSGARVTAAAAGRHFALCILSDRNVGNEYLLRVNGAAFDFVGAGKPLYDLSTLVSLGVPRDEASALIRAIQQQPNARPR